MEQIILLEGLSKSMLTRIKTFIVINNNKTPKFTFLLRTVLGLYLFIIYKNYLINLKLDRYVDSTIILVSDPEKLNLLSIISQIWEVSMNGLSLTHSRLIIKKNVVSFSDFKITILLFQNPRINV